MHRDTWIRGRRLAFSALCALAIVPASLEGKDPEKGWKGTENALKSAILASRFDVAAEIVTELAASDDPRGYELIVKVALGGHDHALDLHAGRLVAGASDPKIRQVVYDCVKSGRNYKATIVLLAVLKRWDDDPAAVAALVSALESPRKEVVFAALRWVRGLADQKISVPALVALLDRHERKARGRIYFDTKRALLEITGHDLPTALDWRNYVKAIESGQPPPKPPREGKTVLYKPPTFFSVAVESDRVLFVIDVSTSMSIEDTIIEEKPRAPRDAPRGGGSGRTVVDPEGGSDGGTTVERIAPRQVSRMERVKKELSETIAELPSDVRFNIMSFSHELAWFEPSGTLVISSETSRERALQWVRNLQPNGATRTDKAVDEAFKPSEVDTIYLLTDGAPKDEQNQAIPAESVLRLASSLNRFRKSRIHTIGFSQAGRSMREFVLALARENDGKCVLLEK